MDKDLRLAIDRMEQYEKHGYPLIFYYDFYDDQNHWYALMAMTNDWCIWESLECEKRGLL